MFKKAANHLEMLWIAAKLGYANGRQPLNPAFAYGMYNRNRTLLYVWYRKKLWVKKADDVSVFEAFPAIFGPIKGLYQLNMDRATFES